MPYIKEERRLEYDSIIEDLVKKLKPLVNDDLCGDLNYIISRICWSLSIPTRYARINMIMGVLSAATAEYYRRMAAPYEEKKILENGDVEPAK